MKDKIPQDRLSLKRVGINTLKEYVVYMHAHCHICISEGFDAMTRIQATANGKTIIATLHVVHDDILKKNEAGLSESAWQAVNASEGDHITFSHLQPVESLRLVRKKMYGNALSQQEYFQIMEDIAQRKYSNIELSAFITACVGDKLSVDEIISLTKAMIETGKIISWDNDIIVDKHCVGGLPGNRTTPIIVAIIAAAGLRIPKTSSRAITSPAGTADVMETMTNVELTVDEIKTLVQEEGGCLAWGGGVALSPADDILIKIEKALDIDSEGQMIASVLSKKIAAGSNLVVIDIPVGKTAKIRNEEMAEKLKYYFTVVGKAIGLQTQIVITDGSQPVGKGIGPALEAIDVLSVLRQEADAPQDLRERAISLAGAILELAQKAPQGKGIQMAGNILDSGKAYEKFINICLKQGGFREPVAGTLTYDYCSKKSGTVIEVDNRRLAKLAKLSGAPNDQGAGIVFHVSIGTKVKRKQTLFTIHAESSGELEYAKTYLEDQQDIISVK